MGAEASISAKVCVGVCVCVLETGGMSIFLQARLLKSDFFLHVCVDSQV